MRKPSAQVLKSDGPADPSNEVVEDSMAQSHGLLKDAASIERQDYSMKHIQSRQQFRLQYLVRRFLSQMLYGCTEPYCTAPMCRSCQTRVKGVPYRPPTHLTARALAYHMAVENNPSRFLCPNTLKVPPHELGFEDMAGNGGGKRLAEEAQVAREVSEAPQAGPGAQSEGKSDSDSEENGAGTLFWDALREQRARRKDKLSLGQNLYDTMAAILFYFKMMPHPGEGVVEDLESVAVPRDKPEKNSADSANFSNTNGDAVERNRSKSTGENISLKLLVRNPMDSTSTQPGLRANQKHSHHGRSHGLLGHGNAHTSCGLTSTSMLEMKRQVKPLPLGSLDGIETVSISPLYMDTSRYATRSSDSINQSLFYHLSDFENLLQSFQETPFPDKSLVAYDSQINTFKYWNPSEKSCACQHLNPWALGMAFRGWREINGSLIYDSLYIALEALFHPPPSLATDSKSPRMRTKKMSRDPSPLSSPLDFGNLPGNQKNTTFPPKPHLRSSTRKCSAGRYLNDHEAAHIIMICFHALVSSIPEDFASAQGTCWKRSSGCVLPSVHDLDPEHKATCIENLDAFEYEPALRLAERLVKAIAARRCFYEIEHKLGSAEPDNRKHSFKLMELICSHLMDVKQSHAKTPKLVKAFFARISGNRKSWARETFIAEIQEWLRTVCIRNWDKSPVVNRWDVVGGSVEIMNDLWTFRYKNTRYEHRLLGGESCHDRLHLPKQWFRMPLFYEHLDKVQAPTDFMSYKPGPNELHLFSFPFLFNTNQRLRIFRTNNYARMFSYYEAAERRHHLHGLLNDLNTRNSSMAWSEKYKKMFQRYLVLDVRRDHALEDSFDQLWYLEKGQLLRPLKVRIGQLEGEDALDQGGVSLEFFRIALADAFNSDNGLFTVDPETHMTWFKPDSLAPLYHFELIGILFSLAVYNGITLPVTFPLVFYHHLLGFSSRDITISYLSDGWPQLMRSFTELISTREDVSEMYGGDYEFTYEAFGGVKTIDMTTLPQSARRLDLAGLSRDPGLPHINSVLEGSATRPIDDLTEAPPVTTENRVAFVRDYLYMLVEGSVLPQLAAFKRGFRSCLDTTAMSFFDPETLRTTIEGLQDINLDELRRVTSYEDGYNDDSLIIEQFWAVVEEYDHTMKKKLLEFVTASDRVPIGGFDKVLFSIVRAGSDSELLPTASTCFGKLLLPEYENTAKLKRKLEVALMYSKGFGTV